MSDQAVHEQFICRAIELARHGIGAGAGGPFGCVIVAMGKSSARGLIAL